MEQQIHGACLESAPARNSPRRIARTLCVRGPQACTPAHRSACVHVPRAGLHVEEHACTRVVLTRTPKNMRACASCWLVRRRTCVHEPCADMQAGEHACTSFVRESLRTRSPMSLDTCAGRRIACDEAHLIQSLKSHIKTQHQP